MNHTRDKEHFGVRREIKNPIKEKYCCMTETDNQKTTSLSSHANSMFHEMILHSKLEKKDEKMKLQRKRKRREEEEDAEKKTICQHLQKWWKENSLSFDLYEKDRKTVKLVKK